jgi:uncharacterized membrane protein YkoI
MIRMTRKTLAMSAIAAVTLTGTLAMMMTPGGQDFETIPPPHKTVESTLRDAPVSLGKAIEIATGKTGGICQSAALDLAADPPNYNLVVYNEGMKKNITIDTTSGSILNSTEVARFPGMPVSGDWTETDTGLKYYDIVVGDGEMPVNNTSIVRVHYTGYFTNGVKFDSSVDHGEPAMFPLNQVIAGWTEGVGSMREGGKRKLVIPYNLAYGENGRRGSIPPRATLFFDVELLEVVK